MTFKRNTSRIFIIPAIYFVAGILWIKLSDTLLFRSGSTFSLSPEVIETIATWKGYFYVSVTSLLLYFLIRATTKSIIATKNDFKRLFEENPNPMWIYDLETLKFLLVNNVACEQYEYNRNEFLHLDLFAIRPAGEYEKLKANIRATETGFTDSGEWLHRSKLGKLFYVNIFSHETTYNQRNCRMVTAININKRVLAEIDHSNLQKALDNAALVSITDLSSIILEANNKFCEVSKYSVEELVGKSHNIISSGYHSKEFWFDMEQAVSKGKTWRADIKNKSKDGSFYWVDSIINPVFDSEGKIYKYMFVQYDITERKKLEEQQQELLNDLGNYAFQTSHELRGPLARMLGLISIFNGYPEKTVIMDKIKETSLEMDTVIKKMNETLNRTSYDIMTRKREAGVSHAAEKK